jgi:hypothetical protein
MTQDNYICIGLHDKKLAEVETKNVGNCLICGEPVHLAKMGVTGELDIKDLRKIKGLRLIGNTCVFDIVKAFSQIMSASQEQRQSTIDKLLKKEKKL